jgi:hypothetical protein
MCGREAVLGCSCHIAGAGLQFRISVVFPTLAAMTSAFQRELADAWLPALPLGSL